MQIKHSFGYRVVIMAARSRLKVINMEVSAYRYFLKLGDWTESLNIYRLRREEV